MTGAEFDKIAAATRKSVGAKFGFKKCDYASYKTVDGYFFALFHLTGEVYLSVKPLYADDLWCDIFQMPENKKPLSLRAIGAFTLDGVTISKYLAFSESYKNYSDQEIEKIWTDIFQKIEIDINVFISGNRSADKFIPPKFFANGNASLLYLIALMHNNRAQEVIDIIHNEQKLGNESDLQRYVNGESVDGYDYILSFLGLSLNSPNMSGCEL